MIAIGGVVVILLFVGILFYLDYRTRKEMRQHNTHH